MESLAIFCQMIRQKKKVLIPEIRAELKKLYVGPEEGFEDFLIENFFDLHYQLLPDAQPVSLGIGHMWRLAIDHPAPKERSGERRLLLIS